MYFNRKPLAIQARISGFFVKKRPWEKCVKYLIYLKDIKQVNKLELSLFALLFNNRFIICLLVGVDGRTTPLPRLEIEPVTTADMEAALAHTKPSARQLQDKYKEWQKEYESVWFTLIEWLTLLWQQAPNNNAVLKKTIYYNTGVSKMRTFDDRFISLISRRDFKIFTVRLVPVDWCCSVIHRRSSAIARLRLG